MAENDIEIAPMGTRALLRDVAKHLREDEEAIRAGIVRSGDVEEGDPLVVTTPAESDLINARADRNARIAGRVEALLAGWEG